MNENYYCAHLISIATLNKLLDRTELIGWTESVENYDKSFWLIFRFNFLLFILLCIAWCVRACSTTKCLCSINFFFIYCLSHSTELCKSSHWIIISSALLDNLYVEFVFFLLKGKIVCRDVVVKNIWLKSHICALQLIGRLDFCYCNFSKHFKIQISCVFNRIRLKNDDRRETFNWIWILLDIFPFFSLNVISIGCVATHKFCQLI